MTWSCWRSAAGAIVKKSWSTCIKSVRCIQSMPIKLSWSHITKFVLLPDWFKIRSTVTLVKLYIYHAIQPQHWRPQYSCVEKLSRRHNYDAISDLLGPPLFNHIRYISIQFKVFINDQRLLVSELPHWGLVTSDVNKKWGQHWLG